MFTSVFVEKLINPLTREGANMLLSKTLITLDGSTAAERLCGKKIWRFQLFQQNA